MPSTAASSNSKPTKPAHTAPALEGLPLLDLPEIVLDRILEELSPTLLAVMACVGAAPIRDQCFRTQCSR